MSWVERAQVGDKVVAVEGVWEAILGEAVDEEPIPVPNCIYTVWSIHLCNEEVMFAVEELEHDALFSASGFRPIRDTTLQVEAIKRAALDVPAKSPEPVA